MIVTDGIFFPTGTEREIEKLVQFLASLRFYGTKFSSENADEGVYIYLV